MPKEKLLDVKRINAQTAVAKVLVKRIDDSNYEAMGNQLMVLAKKYEISHILLNLDEVKTLVSMALAKLLALDKHLRSVGGELRLCQLGEVVREVFVVTGIEKRIKLFDTETAALDGWN